MANKILLEIAVASLERALAAQRAGAHRLELCATLETGGLTPSLELVRQVRAAVILPIHVLIRPRAGSFLYTDNEFGQMKSEVAAFRAQGIEGIVAGVLSSDGTVDIARTRELVNLAAPLPVTFHRAFDETPSLKQALDNVIRAGAQRVLTSAGAASAADAPEAIRQLVAQAGDRIILPGGGLHAGNISRVAQLPGIRELHTGLGTVMPYSDPDTARFESAIRACLAAL